MDEDDDDGAGGAGGKAEKPEFWAKIERSRASSPMAMATCFSAGETGDVMMPNGMLAREKCEPLGIETQDFNVLDALAALLVKVEAMFASNSTYVVALSSYRCWSRLL